MLKITKMPNSAPYVEFGLYKLNSIRLGPTMTDTEAPNSKVLQSLAIELARARRELAAVEENKDRPLEEFFVHLIAASQEIEPEQVTEEFILRQRDEHVYPTSRYTVHSPIGGYNGGRLAALTRQEIEALDEKVDRHLSEFLAASE